MNRFKELRVKNGYKTQQDLAAVLFVNQTAVSQWERGVTIPSPPILLKLSELYGVSTDYLLGRTDETKSSSNIRVSDEQDRTITLDDDALELIDSLRSRPEMKMLFSVSKKATSEDIIKAVKIIEALRDESEN